DSLKSGIARISNIYGEYCKLGKTAHVVPALIRKAINYPTEPFIVWGDGTQTRNLMYINDCIEGLLKLEEHASYPPLKVNLGNPETVTIRELAETIVSISGKNIRITFDPTKPVGPLSRIPDIRRAEKELDWKPETSLRVGLERINVVVDCEDVEAEKLATRIGPYLISLGALNVKVEGIEEIIPSRSRK